MFIFNKNLLIIIVCLAQKIKIKEEKKMKKKISNREKNTIIQILIIFKINN